MRALAMAGILAAAAASILAPEARAADFSVRVVIAGGRPAERAPRGDWRDTGPAFRYGYDRGWRDGTAEGHRDGRRARAPRYWREDDFRDADAGYRRWMGPRHEYVTGYRRGYESGYRRAYAAARPEWRDRDGGRHAERDRDRDRDRQHERHDDDRSWGR